MQNLSFHSLIHLARLKEALSMLHPQIVKGSRSCFLSVVLMDLIILECCLGDNSLLDKEHDINVQTCNLFS